MYFELYTIYCTFAVTHYPSHILLMVLNSRVTVCTSYRVGQHNPECCCTIQTFASSISLGYNTLLLEPTLVEYTAINSCQSLYATSTKRYHVLECSTSPTTMRYVGKCDRDTSNNEGSKDQEGASPWVLFFYCLLLLCVTCLHIIRHEKENRLLIDKTEKKEKKKKKRKKKGAKKRQQVCRRHNSFPRRPPALS